MEQERRRQKAAEAETIRVPREQLSELRLYLEASRRASGKPHELVALDMAFIEIIAQASRNPALQLYHEPIGQLLYLAVLPVMQRPPAGKRLLHAHDAILAALEARNAQAARQWTRRHVADFRRGYEAAGLDIERPVVWPVAGAPIGDGAVAT